MLSNRLARLFEVQRPPENPHRRWTNREVVAACKASGRELSESHLSELRRGVKKNPTVRTLQSLAWFFQVREGYFTDRAVAAEVERDLADREAALHARLEESLRAEDELRAATAQLQQAMRSSGVTRTAHRGVGDLGAAREQASMIRALARALTDEDEDRLFTDTQRSSAPASRVATGNTAGLMDTVLNNATFGSLSERIGVDLGGRFRPAVGQPVGHQPLQVENSLAGAETIGVWRVRSRSWWRRPRPLRWRAGTSRGCRGGRRSSARPGAISGC